MNFTTLSLQIMSSIINKQFKYLVMRMLKPTNYIHYPINLLVLCSKIFSIFSVFLF